MAVDLRCRGCTLTEQQRAHVEDRIARLEKYLGAPERVEVHVERAGNPANPDRVVTEVTYVVSKAVVRARGVGETELESFDRAEERLKRRLERLKGRLVARSHPHHRGGAEAPEARLDIRRRKRFALQPLDPQSAAFRMDLLDHSFYLFINEETGRPAVVYRREDGTVGLIDQAEEEGAGVAD
ncbi:putative sigma 54 modulation protein/ribosomal protein S30EA [Acidimicrobium ferrooxidans DSM 10331]|uniref:Ribosome hibernation promoting factor n=1 Tax=Acidimicrobium ferrooxidans (strain DSM 10331 / JCM 15462 / NBRC 103882 / ICP) TaxID=525909 RepID=C7M130_ACIFD|nr:ribosome-associated translation inhibitor RaiA [Acidimicrobium ferrooxidans]ACU54678.1 putative sigma 54 modulation protein/ribosomal protein S30EA [Acidimicrobium ferrooxidans DSM 10331]